MGRWIPIALGLLATVGSALAQEPGDVQAEAAGYQKLSTLLSAASRHSPGVRAARHNISAAEALLSEAKGSPYFQFTAEGVIGVAPNVRGTPVYSLENNQLGFGEGGWNVVTGANVSGAIPLYTWGKLRSARNAAEAGIDVAEGSLERVMDQLHYDVRRAYFGLQFALDVLQLIHEGKGKLQDALESLKQRLEDGDSNAREEDVWRLSATISEIEAREAEARQLEDSSRAALAVLTGIDDVSVIDCPSERVAYELKPLEFYTDAARLNRPEGRILDGAVQARKSAVDAASSHYFPDLALVLGVGRTWSPGRTDQLNPFASDPGNRGRFEAGIAARWSLDFWGHHARTEKAEAELNATQAMQAQADDGIEIEVTAAYQQVVAMQTTEQAWARGHKDTRAWFLAATQAYQIGTNEPKDVVDAVRAYFGARAAHLDAIRKHNTGLAELERVAGTHLVDEASWENKCY